VAEHVFSYGHDALNNLTYRELVSAPGGSAMPKMLSAAHVHGTGGLGPRQLALVLTPGGTHGFNWDAAGRLVTLTPPTGPPGTGLVASALVYDAFDRLRLVTDDDGVATATTAHAYGSDGQRTATRWPDGRAELRPAPDVAAYGDGTGTGTMTHLTWHIGLGGARQVARLAAPLGSAGTLPAAVAEVQYLHQGFGPGTTLVTAADGSTLEERFFEPFGASLLASADYTLESHGWNAKPMDPWHEWSDHGARWHATPLGRWTAADPPLRGPEGLMKHGLDASTYGFVAGNPVAFWDPDGNQPFPFISCINCFHEGGPGGAAMDALRLYKKQADERQQLNFIYTACRAYPGGCPLSSALMEKIEADNDQTF